MKFITILIVLASVCAANARIKSYEDLVLIKSKTFSTSPKFGENYPQSSQVKNRQPGLLPAQQIEIQELDPEIEGLGTQDLGNQGSFTHRLTLQNLGMQEGTQEFQTKGSETQVIQTKKFTTDDLKPEVVYETQSIRRPLGTQYYTIKSREYEPQDTKLEESGAQNYQPKYLQNFQSQEIESQNYPLQGGVGSQMIQSHDAGFQDDKTQEDSGFQNIQPQDSGSQGFQPEEGSEPEKNVVPDSETQGSQSQEVLEPQGLQTQDSVSQISQSPEESEPQGLQTQNSGSQNSQSLEGSEPQGLPIQEFGSQESELQNSQPQKGLGSASLEIQEFGSQNSQSQEELQDSQKEVGADGYETLKRQAEDSESVEPAAAPHWSEDTNIYPQYHPTNTNWPNWESRPLQQRPFTPSSFSIHMHGDNYQPNNYQGILGNAPQKPWVAPPYHQALKDFDHALTNIRKHFKPETYMYEDDQNFRFLVIAVVIDGLSKIVSEKGWNYYDNNYEQLVKSLSYQAVVDPKASVDEIRCVFRHSNKRIAGIRKLINNKWNRFICKVQPSACDTVLYGQLKTFDQDYLRKQAILLLKLGDAASTYLCSYAKVFEAVSYQSSFQYVMTGRDAIREQVKKNAIVRDILYPNGGPSKDECN